MKKIIVCALSILFASSSFSLQAMAKFACHKLGISSKVALTIPVIKAAYREKMRWLSTAYLEDGHYCSFYAYDAEERYLKGISGLSV